MLPKLTWSAALLAACVFAFTACFGGGDSSSSKPSSASSTVPSSSSMHSSSSGVMDKVESGASDVMSGAMSDASDAWSEAVSDASDAMSDARSRLDAREESGVMSESRPAAAEAESSWALRLVNAESPLPEGFSVETRAIPGYENREFDARAADALEQMLSDAEAAGCKLYLVSAYRSVARQDALFRRKTEAFMEEGFPREEAERQAARYVARPGTSEHNLGLAADIVSADWYSSNNDLTTAFEDTPHFAWLAAHCADYGFILRYPEGKEAVTGVTYEPWHYRYVGADAARAIMENGLTLEEYVGKT